MIVIVGDKKSIAVGIESKSARIAKTSFIEIAVAIALVKTSDEAVVVLHGCKRESGG